MHGVKEDEVSIAWDEVTIEPAGSHIKPEIRYCVYISKLTNKEDAKLVEKSVNNIMFKADTPIADTSCTIKFPYKGTFYIGVQSVVYEKRKPVVCKKEKSINRSEIAWSDKEIYTNNNPFLVNYEY